MNEMLLRDDVLASSTFELHPLIDNPLVSILIANFNREQWVGAAIESCLAQSYPHVEIVVCDDGSTDESWDIICSYTDAFDNVKAVQKVNGGMASAFNRAFGASSGGIICLLDSDDTFRPTKVEEVVRTFRNNPASAYVHHPMMMVDIDDNQLQPMPFGTVLEQGWLRDKVIERGGSWTWTMTSAMALRRQLASMVFPIPEMLRWSADGHIAILSAYLTEISLIDEPLTHYRIHGENYVGPDLTNSARVSRMIEIILLHIQAANERLSEWGVVDLFDPDRHTFLRFLEVIRKSLDGESRWNVVTAYTRLLPTLVREELTAPWSFRTVWRLARLFLLLMAFLSPGRIRSAIFVQLFGQSQLKRRVIRLIRFQGNRRQAPSTS